MESKPVRIQHWQQETIESGRWLETEPMTYEHAESLVALGAFERPTIIEDNHDTDTD